MRLKSYALVLTALAAALVARFVLDPYLGNLLPYVTFFVAVTCVAWYEGLGLTLVTLLAGACLADYFFIPPRHTFAIYGLANLVGFGTYFMVTIPIAFLAQRQKRNATALIEAQAQLSSRQSEEQFRTLANAIPQLCWMASADGSIYWYNQRWYDYTGTTQQQMEGWGWQSVHDPKTLPNVLQRWKASIASGEPFDMVFPLLGADGVFRPFLTRVMPAKDAENKVVHWFGTNTDISEQQKTEETLRESEERYRRLFDAPLTEAKPAVLLTSTKMLLCAAIVLLVVNGTFAYRSVVRLAEHDHWVSHTYQVIGELEQLISLLKDAETGNRGYVLVGTDKYLEPYNAAVTNLHAQVNAVKELTSDNPVQQQRFPELEQKVNQRMALLQRGIELRRQGVTGQAQVALQDAGQQEMDEIRNLVASMKDEEYRLLEERRTDSARSAWGSELALVLASVLAITFLLLLARLLRREQSLREASVELAERFRSLFEYAPVGIKQVSLDGRLLTANPALCRMLDYSEDELVGKTFEELTHPDDRDRERQQIDAMLRGQRQFVHIELRYLRHDDSPVEVTLATSVVKNAAGKPLYRISIVQDITERKRAEQAAVEAEERLRFALESCHIGAWELDLIHQTAYRTAEQGLIFGYYEMTPHWTFADFIQHVLPEHRASIEALVSEARSAGRGWSFECPIRRVDGEIRWIWVSGRHHADSFGHPRIVGVVQDVTERKLAEQALRDSEERFRTLVEQASDAFFLHDEEGHFIDVNRQACESLGYTREELLGMDVFDVETELDPVRVRKAWQSVEPNKALTVSGHHRKKDGTRFPIEARLSMCFVEGQKRFLGLVRDITERKQAEEALRLSLERLERVLEVETVGVMFWDLSTGCMVDANDAFLKLMGYSRSQVESRELNWQDLTPPEYMDVSRAEVQKFMETGRIGPYEKEYFCKDGTKRSLLFAGSSLGNNQCVEFCVDISDRKKAEQQLVELNQQLEERVRRRTAELEASNRELEAFSYSVSHDLRSPLRTMDGFSHALMEDYAGGLDEKGQHYITRISRAAQKMGQLIDDLLQLSRIGRAEMRIKSVDLSEMALGVIEELRGSEPERVVEVQIEPGLETKGDPGLLQVVLQNLLSNAWKFTSRRAAARIEFGRLTNGSSAAFFVRDNGAGFEMKYAEHLFSPFKRLHAEEEFKGTGIGLATVQRIIRRHQGQIWADASKEKGATFYFELGSHSGRSPGVSSDRQKEAIT